MFALQAHFSYLYNEKVTDMKKILIIAPHADDEVLGCGGYMLSQSKDGAEIKIIFCAIGGDDAKQDRSIRVEELKSACKEVNASYEIMSFGTDALLDKVACKDIISYIDKQIESFRPDEVFVNYPSRHQDHIKVYEATMAALRLKEGYMPPFVALYEYPFILNHYDKVDGGRWYHDITATISDKVDLFYKYKSQVKKLPSPLNKDGIETLAKTRGLESGLGYAEMFYIQKIVR